jgi:hypothetical protein
MSEPLHTFIAAQLALARAKGLRRPTLLLCSTRCEQAQAVHRAVTGEPLEPSEDAVSDEEWVPLDAVETALACQLLREHGGAGGACAADHLADKAVRTEVWVVMLMAAGIRFIAFAAGKQLVGGEARWDRVGRATRPIGQVMREDGPSHLRLRMDDGEQALVFGPTGKDTVMATGLVTIVQSGKLTVDHPLTGEPHDIEVDDRRLEDLLANVYASGSGPRQVAEAIQALKRLSGDPSRRLIRLLRDCPSLRRLHHKVWQELTSGA